MYKYYIDRLSYKTVETYLSKNEVGCRCGVVCYGLYREEKGGLFESYGKLVGVVVFAQPWNIDKRNSVFGEDYGDWVTEIHRFVYDNIPKSVAKKFLKNSIKLLNKDVIGIHAILVSVEQGNKLNDLVVSSGFKFCSTTSKYTVKLDKNGKLSEYGSVVRVGEKNRYIMLLANSVSEKLRVKKMCKLFN